MDQDPSYARNKLEELKREAAEGKEHQLTIEERNLLCVAITEDR